MKLIVKIVAVLILLLVIVVFGALFYIDSIAKAGIEQGGTRALDVETTVSSVNVGILSGTVSIEGLSVANPEGYGGGNFLDLGRGETKVFIGELMGQPAVIQNLGLADIELYLEKKPGKKGNYEVIIDNLKRFETDAPAEPTEEGKRFVIKQVVISNVDVVANVLPIGGKATSLKFNVPEIRFAYDDEKGVPMGQITGAILKAILKSVVDKAGGILPDDILGGLGSQLAGLEDISKLGVEVIGDLTKLGELGKNLENLDENIGENVEKVGEQVEKTLEEGVGKALDGLGGLLKKKDK